ncbi:cell division protein [Enterococcus sp. AZ109]|uniref:cell division protein n=1 Tax=Enterococcus sp. AZ109 TaxID=2774634 RepID=UPI003F289819
MKKTIGRDEVTKILVSDRYYEKGNLLLKLVQTVVGIIGWLLVILPFVWVLAPFDFKEIAFKHHLFPYAEEVQTLIFLVIFLAISFVAILILYILLTMRNNYRFGDLLQNQEMHNVERLEKRKKLLETDFAQRFGKQEERELICYYVVKEEQNLATHYARDLYKEGGVDL